MKCGGYRELFSDFTDGELSEEQAQDFRSHLRSCKACKEEFARFRQARTLLRLLPKKEAPSDLWEVIEAQVKPVEKKLVFFVQSFSTFEGFRPGAKASLPVRIYGISFGMPGRGFPSREANRNEERFGG